MEKTTHRTTNIDPYRKLTNSFSNLHRHQSKRKTKPTAKKAQSNRKLIIPVNNETQIPVDDKKAKTRNTKLFPLDELVAGI